MTGGKDFSELFSYQEYWCCEFLHKTPEIIFRDIELLQDFHTYKGIYVKGTTFAEASLDISTLLLTFIQDDPYVGFYTEVEVNMRMEQDL